MAFGGKKNEAALRISADRLASVAGGGGSAAAVEDGPAFSGPSRRVSLEPDLSRIKPRGVDETPEERQRRLAAKTVNFTATFLARLILMAALAKYGYDAYQMTGVVHRGVAVGMFAMVADFGRVALKAMEPGTK